MNEPKLKATITIIIQAVVYTNMSTKLTRSHIYNFSISLSRYIRASSTYGDKVVDQLSRNIPWYLRDRPHYFLRHCMIQVAKEDSQFNPKMIIGPVEHKIYKV